MLRRAAKLSVTRMGRCQVFVYKGYGMYEKDSAILHRELTLRLMGLPYNVSYITPEEIKEGSLKTNAKLLVIGGGFDLGLIKALGQQGMTQIKQFVGAGGSYLGICSGAYFACDYIEFDKDGPLQVLGERFLKFYPGVSVGPLYKRYVYNSTEGAVAAHIDFSMLDTDGTDADMEHLNTCEPHSIPTNASGDCSSADDIGEVKDKLDADTDNEKQHNNHAYTYTSSCFHTDACCCKNNAHINTKTKNAHINIDTAETCKNKRADKKEMTGQDTISCGKGCMLNLENSSMQAKIHFNGGGHFIRQSMKSYPESQTVQTTSAKRLKTVHNGDCHKSDEPDEIVNTAALGDGFKNVTVLARYLDLPNRPDAMVKCKVGQGVAVLSGGHFEYNAEDIEDEGDHIMMVVNDLKKSRSERSKLFTLVLKHLNMSTDTNLSHL